MSWFLFVINNPNTSNNLWDKKELYQIFSKTNVIFQEKACEDVDMADVGPVSLDSKKSQQTKLEKLREEAQYEKERVRKQYLSCYFYNLFCIICLQQPAFNYKWMYNNSFIIEFRCCSYGRLYLMLSKLPKLAIVYFKF